MKVHEIISESRLDEGATAEIFDKIWASATKLFDKNLLAAAAKKAGNGGAEKYVRTEIISKYKTGGFLGFGEKLDQAQWAQMDQAATRYADERFDAQFHRFEAPRPIETIVKPKVAGTAGTGAQQVSTGIMGVDGKEIMKTVPGTKGTAAVENDLFTKYPSSKQDVLDLAEAKFLDRCEDLYKTTDPKKLAQVAEKAAFSATKKASETVANRFARRYGTSIGIKESLGVLQKTWLTANCITTVVILYKPLSTYFTNMEAARKYLELGDEGFQQLKNAGQLEGMTIDGQSPQNVEEWFVLYNHAQLQVCVAKLAEALTVTFVVSGAGYGVFRGMGAFIPGVKKLTNLAAPAAFNLFLNAMMQDPEPGKVMLGIVMNTWLGKATWIADIWQEYQIPSEGEARARYTAVVDKINKGIESGGEDNKEAEPTTPVGQGGKADTANGATVQDKSTWKRDWQGYPINPATGIAELD
jgi:hypothetical protein